jgi:hypothetical protein
MRRRLAVLAVPWRAAALAVAALVWLVVPGGANPSPATSYRDQHARWEGRVGARHRRPPDPHLGLPRRRGSRPYDQGSRPMVGPDGTLYVIFEGATRLSTLDSQWIVKSTDGGATWSAPTKIADVQDIVTPANAAFRVNSFPAGDVAPNGDLYVAWSTQVKNSDGSLCVARTNTGCHVAAVSSKSTNGGATWSAPAVILPALDASNRTPIGYPVTNPDGSTLDAPAAWTRSGPRSPSRRRDASTCPRTQRTSSRRGRRVPTRRRRPRGGSTAWSSATTSTTRGSTTR